MEVLKYGNMFLTKRAQEVKEIDNETREELDMMYATMLKEGGIGLAGTQVGLDKRLVVIDLCDGAGRIDLINPVILSSTDIKEEGLEGCLSVPDLYAQVERNKHIKVEGYNVEGEKLSFEAEGLLARAIQHEIDHLDGILFIDRLESMEKKRLGKKLKKLRKQYAGQGSEDIYIK